MEMPGQKILNIFTFLNPNLNVTIAQQQLWVFDVTKRRNSEAESSQGKWAIFNFRQHCQDLIFALDPRSNVVFGIKVN